MTAIEAMTIELKKIEKQMVGCVTESGHVRQGYSYEYQYLIQQARKFKESIEYMQELQKKA